MVGIGATDPMRPVRSTSISHGQTGEQTPFLNFRPLFQTKWIGALGDISVLRLVDGKSLGRSVWHLAPKGNHFEPLRISVRAGTLVNICESESGPHARILKLYSIRMVCVPLGFTPAGRHLTAT